MAIKKVYVTRKILEPALSMLLKECNVVLNNKDRPTTRKEILKNVRGKDGILCMLSDNRSTRNHQIESELKAEYVDINSILEQSDFLSIHTTLNKDRFHLLDESKFRKMKKTAYIINTSRGQIINESDLIKAIKNNWIAGVGLDVFEKEPLSN